MANDPTSPSELDSLPSSPTTHSSRPTTSGSSWDESTSSENDAEKEWKESLQQLELLLTMVVVPYIGKYFGRKCAFWGWAKLMTWKYPNVEVKVTDPTRFKAVGAVEAAATL